MAITTIVALLVITRKRRWRGRALLGRATTMPPEHVAPEPKTVRDMEIGEEGFVSSSYIVTSKKRRQVFVAWDARLQDQPQNPSGAFAPLHIRRLARGFSLTVGPGDEFRTGMIPWGWYAPVTEVLQAAPSESAKAK